MDNVLSKTCDMNSASNNQESLFSSFAFNSCPENSENYLEII